MIVNTRDLDEAHKAYTDKKIMREDMFRIVIENIKAERARLDAVIAAEAERRAQLDALIADVAALKAWMTSVENNIDTKVAMAASAAMTIWSKMTEDVPPPAAPGKRGPGRPKLEAVEAVSNG